jgi:hypothetical protein
MITGSAFEPGQKLVEALAIGWTRGRLGLEPPLRLAGELERARFVTTRLE